MVQLATTSKDIMGF